jgi:hypothetical protein
VEKVAQFVGLVGLGLMIEFDGRMAHGEDHSFATRLDKLRRF